MKVGDLVQDCELGMTGIILGQFPGSVIGYFSILYEDGVIGEAFENALEVISESR